MTGANKTLKILKLKNKNGSKHIKKKKEKIYWKLNKSYLIDI